MTSILVQKKKEWDEFYKKAGVNFDEKLYGKRNYQPILERLDREDKILDIGCGNLNYSADFSGRHFIGLDFSYEGLKAAKERNPEVNLICASGTHLPFKDDIFDFVSCLDMTSGVIYLYKNLFDEIARVSRKDVLLTLNHEEDVSYKIMKYGRLTIKDCIAYCNEMAIAPVFNEENISSLMKSVGLKIENLIVMTKDDFGEHPGVGFGFDNVEDLKKFYRTKEALVLECKKES